MRRRPTVISCGLCCDSGSGVEAAYGACFGKSGFLFTAFGENGMYVSRRFSDARAGAAKGFSAYPQRLPRCARILFSAVDEVLEGIL